LSTEDAIDLRTPLSLGSSYRFPLQSALSRREVMVGALWLLVPIFGWLINMGHRIRFVHNMQHGRPPWPAFTSNAELLRHGAITFAGMVWYGWPGVSLMLAGGYFGNLWVFLLGFVLWLLAVIAIPGYMTHYCYAFDSSEIFDPRKALRRVAEGGLAYWHAWTVAASAMLLSFLGLLGFGIGFLWTSVWFWQVAGFSFATVFTQTFQLQQETAAQETA
jgi:hypothetical protein